ncbi:unnamed protein product, partial [Caretta caretta]
PLVTQGSLGCELHPNGTSRGFDDAGVNGEDFVSFDADAGSWLAWRGDKLALYARDLLNRDKGPASKIQFLLRTWVSELKSFVQHGKGSLERQGEAGHHSLPCSHLWAISGVGNGGGFYKDPSAWTDMQPPLGWGRGLFIQGPLAWCTNAAIAGVEHSSLGGQSLLIPWGHSRGWGPGLAVGITLGALAVAAVAGVLWRSRRRGYQGVRPGESR